MIRGKTYMTINVGAALAKLASRKPRPAPKKETPLPPPDPAAQPTRQLRRKAERELAKLARREGKSSAPPNETGAWRHPVRGQTGGVQPPSPGSYPDPAGRGGGG